ncbi:helix-turn-helix domain-containing protein [Algoriphagus namhaensis]
MPCELVIKNMVCPRCIAAVTASLEKLKLNGKVSLGQVILAKEPSPNEKKQLAALLREQGFELLEPGKSALISKIKTLIVDLVHHQDQKLHKNLSSYLSDQLHQEYTGLSKLFSAVEGMTIERFYTLQRIEKVKEYIFYDEFSLSEIAFRMGYSSAAYLSAQFKKETGMTPSQFKKNGGGGRKGLDGI